jgi:hypothetical protein
MSRRRFISTEISLDSRLNKVSDFAALLYTWGIPHARDDCRISPQNAEELLLRVVPGRNKTIEDVEEAVKELFEVGLLGIDENGEIYYPSKSFYKYQTYINAEKRRETAQNSKNQQETPRISKEQQETARNSTLPSPSPSLSPSLSLKEEIQISASPDSDNSKKGDFGMSRSMNLTPELKAIADKVYYSDPVKFKRIAAWIGQGRKHGYPESEMTEALSQFWEYRFIDDWFPYLDEILDKVHKDRGMRESQAEHQRQMYELMQGSKSGPTLALVKGLAEAKGVK